MPAASPRTGRAPEGTTRRHGRARLAAAVVAPGTWIVAVALLALGLLLESSEADAPTWARAVFFGVLPAIVLAVAAAVLSRGRHWVAIAGLALAVSPAVLTATAASMRQGAVAVVVAAGVAVVTAEGWWDDIRVRIAAASLGVVLLGADWSAATRQFAPDRPDFEQAIGGTGSFLRGVTSSLGRSSQALPASGHLLWWLGVGAVVGATVVHGPVRRSSAVPLAVAVVCVFSWFVRMWRGPIDPRHVAWILSAAVAYTAASALVAGRVAVRLAGTIGGLAALTWLYAVATIVG